MAIDLHLWRGEVLAGLARLLDYTASTTDGAPVPVPHHSRVAALAVRMASHLRVDRLDVFYAGLIHDIGLLGNSSDADRRRNLDDQANRPLMRAHPIIGAELAAETPELFSIAPMILDHHECISGHGYPRGKSDSEIAPEAQILRFADTCDVLFREQGTPEIISFLHAARGRTATEVSSAVADAGVEALGEPGFYAQLLTAADVDFLIESVLHRVAADDLVLSETELTGLLELFAHVADAYPSHKTGHSRRVAHLAVLVALALGLKPDEVTKIRWAALVHDVGVIAVPKSILDKPDHLSADEVAAVRRHASATEQFIAPIRGLEEVARIASSHGESFDGSGYPRGLAGREIPLGGRILAVCDTFDALTSHRPYREARDTTLSVDILIKGSGSIFDPDVVEAAVPALLVGRPAEEPQMADSR
jgi:HD-GYP domain-containing protein (c-di-GMP phosphodiesterase class II)